MYLSFDLDAAIGAEPWGLAAPRTTTAWTVLIPFFNEAAFLGATIASIAAQDVRARLILVDNGSTDGSADVARAAARAHGLDAMVLTERTPGKVAALRTGLAWVRTTYVATCDADTLYPPHYLAEAERLLSREGCVVAGAYFVEPGAGRDDRDAEARKILAAARALPRQCHTGGAGQAFHVASLRAAGGFDPDLWPFILEDHEVIHRIMGQGEMLYSRDLWCMPSPRERDRESIRWTLLERLTYAATAPWAGSWFFYKFLGPRLQRRRLMSNKIRERAYHDMEGPAFATTNPVC